MRSGIFFNHFGRTHHLAIHETGYLGIFEAWVDDVYVTFFPAPDDCELVDLICFAVESWREEFKAVEGIGWSQANGDEPVVCVPEALGSV
jgi:hypothetical protein